LHALFQGYKRKNEFIITQMPLSLTKTDFWRLVEEHDVNIIVMMNNESEAKVRIDYFITTIYFKIDFYVISTYLYVLIIHCHVLCRVSKEDEIYWPDENASVTFGHITVTHRGVEVKGDNIRITLEVKRFKKVITTTTNSCYLVLILIQNNICIS